MTMPTPEEITRVLAIMASELAWLAIAWHVVIAGALAAILRGWRPSSRIASILMTAPIMSVALASIAYGNVFNALSFGLLAFVLAVLAGGLTQRQIERGPTWSLFVGGAVMAFGLGYPHFVEGSWVRVIAAAPVGVVPCPTLAFVAGAVIVAGGFASRAIPLLLVIWVGFYSWFGVRQLGVTLDLGLGVALLGLVAVFVRNDATVHQTARA
jgi:hypothetical protein